MKKASRYNVFINRLNSVVVYNTLWNTFLITNKHYALLLQKGICDSSSYANEKLFNFILEKKMIIDEDLDELEVVRKTLQTTNNPSSYFELIINPTLACNFKCWYCYESHQDTSSIDNSGIDSIVLFVSDLLSSTEVKKIVLKFFGGEPLLAYKTVMKPILKRVQELTDKYGVELVSGVTTNGYFLSRERLEFLHSHCVQSLQITLDGNREQHNKVRFTSSKLGSYDRIVQNIHDALSIGLFVSLRLNISQDTELDVPKLLKDFSHLDKACKSRLMFSVHKVWQEDFSVYQTVEDIVTEIRSFGYKCASYFSDPSSIWNTCYADKPNHLTINPKGKIYKCTACDFSEEHVEGVLSSDGKITWYSLHEKRLQVSPLNIKACRDCSILPICIGGCSQKLIESQNLIDCPLNMKLPQREEYAYRILSEKMEREYV